MCGPLMIHAKNEKDMQKIAYDADRVVLLSDHYHDLSSALLWQYLKPDAENNEPTPNSGLINGRGKVDCRRYANKTCDANAAHFGPVTVRFINVGAFAEFQVQIDEHELAVTEVDGTDVEPVKFYLININPAQRYSVVVTTIVTSDDDQPCAFWLRARTNIFCFKEKSPDFDPDVLAIVRTNPRATELPKSVDWEEKLNLGCKDLDTTTLEPVEVTAAPKAEVYFYLRAKVEVGAYRMSRGVFNNSLWRSNPLSRSLLRSICGLAEQNSSFSASSMSESRDGTVFINNAPFDINRGIVVQSSGVQVIDLLIKNSDDGNQPLHLHGYKCFVLAQGYGYPPKKDKFKN